MSTFLYRLGAACAGHPWRILAAWLLVLVATLGVNSVAGASPHDDYNVPGTQSQAGTVLLREQFPQMSGTSARVVVHDRAHRPLDPAVLAQARARLAALPGVSLVSAPRLSPDGDTALLAVQYRVPVTDLPGRSAVTALDRAVAPTRAAGLEVELGGQVPENIAAPGGLAESIGAVAALVILVVALGSVIAAGLPLVVALCGLGLGTAVIGLLCAVTDISTTAPTVASMVGLGVGIDYALLLLSRHVDGLRQGMAPREAAAHATATAGVSVLTAGLTVLVALFGLKLSTLPTYASFGYATFATVGAAMAAAVTLVPALCGLAGRRLLARRDRSAPASGDQKGTQRWVRWVVRRPIAAALACLALLGGLAAPALGMRTWPQDAGSAPTSNTTRRAYDLVAAEFGPGANGPLLVVVDVTATPVQPLAARLRQLPGVATVADPLISTSGRVAVVVVEPSTGPQDAATTRLLARIRADLPNGALVTGTVAAFADISGRLSGRLWTVIGFVVALSLLLLAVLLRAPVVALKAATMNLLSVAAAYGVVTTVFQTDTGARLVGLPHAGAVSSWVPILMFTILFGLSMDYEVFLLSRVREDWLATGDAQGSVVRGLGATGRVITSAAAIMVAVFVGFALDSDVTVKTLGLGMAVAVFIDATVVRMVLVPATMTLLGRLNWWLPGTRSAPRRLVSAELATDPD